MDIWMVKFVPEERGFLESGIVFTFEVQMICVAALHVSTDCPDKLCYIHSNYDLEHHCILFT